MFDVCWFDDYVINLEKYKVVLDVDWCKEIILNDVKDWVLVLGLELVEDVGFLEEVVGLVEWLVVLIGFFDEVFFDILDECI